MSVSEFRSKTQRSGKTSVFPVGPKSSKGQAALGRFRKLSLPAKEEYNGWWNYDTWAANLVLQDHESTRRWLGDWAKNFKRKMKAGTFDRELAKFAIWKDIVPVAQGKGRFKEFDRIEHEVNHGEFTPEDRIDRDKINYDELLNAILEMNE